MRRKTEQYFIFFMLCSVIGWLYEVFLEVVVYRWGFSNRGVLRSVLYHLRHRRADPAHLPGKTQREKMAYRKNSRHSRRRLFRYRSSDYGGGAGGSYIMEWTKGEWFWDYRRFSFNFQGRIALNPSIRFGIGGMVILYIIWPLLERGCGVSPNGEPTS